MIGFFLYTKALSLGDLSVIGPLDTTRPFFVVIFSIFILHQLPTQFLLIGILCIVLGALLLTLKPRFLQTVDHLKNSPEILFILASTAIFALESIFDKKALGYTQPLEYSFLIMLGVSLSFGLQYIFTTKRIRLTSLLSPVIIGSGFLWTLAYLGIMTATKLATPNVVVPTQMTRSLYLSLLGFLFLGEKGYVKKILAAALMLLGVYFITR